MYVCVQVQVQSATQSIEVVKSLFCFSPFLYLNDDMKKVIEENFIYMP
jgi:hypothetical protein